MVYVTGDMHGDIDRLFDREWRKLKRGDTVIVCGDFGFLWDGGEKEREVIKYLSTRKYNVAFLDGTHDNFDQIAACRKTVWKGGLVHRVATHFLLLVAARVPIRICALKRENGGEKSSRPLAKWRQAPKSLTNAKERLIIFFHTSPPRRLKVQYYFVEEK